MKDKLEKRSVTSVKWNSISNLFHIVMAFVKSIILARLLPIETFGIYSGAHSIIVITGSLLSFGMNAAFTYRCEQTEELERTSRIHFTVQLVLNFIWTTLMLIGGFIFGMNAKPGFLSAFVVLTLANSIATFANTPRYILARQVRYKRIALMSLVDFSLTFVIAVGLAFWGKPLAALLAANVVTAFANIFFMYIWRPVWKPKLMWDPVTVKYFIQFGSKQMASRWLMDALDRVDELWTNAYLGTTALGFYSKAYNFAQYPSQVLANPVSNVAVSTYAEISNNRKRLSNAFYVTNSFLILTGFFFVGVLTLVAPEFIRILLGERWMPMLMSFRLMLPFTLFDPLKKTMSNLFIAVGKPGIMVKIRAIQLVIMVAGLFILGNLYNIEGVALAVDLMMLVGVVLILMEAKKYVNLSIKALFGIPALALGTGLIFGYAVDHLYTGTISDFVSGSIKFTGFSLLYFGIIFLFKKKDLEFVWSMIRKYILRNFLD